VAASKKAGPAGDGPRQKTFGKRAPSNGFRKSPQAHRFAVADGRDAVGTVELTASGAYVAVNTGCVEIGRFHTLRSSHARSSGWGAASNNSFCFPTSAGPSGPLSSKEICRLFARKGIRHLRAATGGPLKIGIQASNGPAEERFPRFTVNTTKNIWNDFGANGSGGDVFAWGVGFICRQSSHEHEPTVLSWRHRAMPTKRVAPEQHGNAVEGRKNTNGKRIPFSRDRQSPQASRRDAPVICPCGKKVKRTARQQKFCSQRCRQRSAYEKKMAEGHYTALPTNPLKKASNINDLRGQKTPPTDFSRAPLDLLGGGQWRWPDTPRLDPQIRRKIFRAEIGASESEIDSSGVPRVDLHR
jgi:hypothetical protein